MSNRTIKFTHDNRTGLLERVIANNYYEYKKEHLDALRKYLEDGDIYAFLENGQTCIDACSVFFMGSGCSLATSIQRLELFMQDCLHHPDKYSSTVHIQRSRDNWDEICVDGLRGQLIGLNNAFLSPQTFHDAFVWFYGEVYQPRRSIDLMIAGEKRVYSYDCSANLIVSLILGHMLNHIFDMRDDLVVDPSMMMPMLNYLKTALPHIDLEVYSKYLYPRFHEIKKGRNSNFSANQSVVRRLLAYYDGIVSSRDIKRGNKTVKIADQDAYEKLKSVLDSVDFPSEYYELIEFIKESGAQYPKATIELDD